MRALLTVFAVLAVTTGAAWVWAGWAEGPRLEIRRPGAFIGQTTTLELLVETPGGQFSRVDVSVEQEGQTYLVFTLDQPSQSTVKQDTVDRLSVMQQIGKRDIPALQPGPARIVVHAARPVLYGLREAQSKTTHDVQVRLEPPGLAVLSTLHYVNHGGAELVVYRATPPDVDSGVRVGNQTYPGFPASGVGINADEAIMVAFFALLHDQDLGTPISLYARDPAGNYATAPLEHRAFPKTFARSRIEINDGFLRRVVPAISATTPDLALSTAPDDLVASFLRINGELRRRNNQMIAKQTVMTSGKMLWNDAFQALSNASVESRFADNRTYFYQGKEIDRQVHLGFDLAVTRRIPVLVANDGFVVYAADLGIYGNSVIVDHGLGVQSLYAHLSSIDVKPGDRVERSQLLGRSGITGLAGGDHLHFAMLVNGHPVNPLEWWDQKWIRDRVLRKLAEAGGV